MNNKTSSLKIILPLIFVIIIDTMGVGLFFPVLSPLFMSPTGILPPGTSQGIRDTLYALVLGSFSIFMFLSAPILGDLSDQLGRKRVLLICLTGTCVSSLFCALGIEIHSFALLILGRIVGGIVSGCQPIAQASIIDISAPNKKIFNIGLISMAGCLGFIIGPIVGGVFSDKELVSWFDYSTPFIADAILALINAFLVVVTFTETFVPSKKIKLNVKAQLSKVGAAFIDKRIRLLVFVLLSYEIAWSLYFQFIAVFLVRVYSYSPRWIGLFMAFIGLILGLTYTVLIRIALKFYREQKIAQFAIALAGISLFLPLIFYSVRGLWWSAIPICIFTGLGWTTLLTLFSDCVSEDQQGWVMGVVSSITALSWVPGAILTSALDYLDVKLPFVVAGTLFFISAMILLKVKIPIQTVALSDKK